MACTNPLESRGLKHFKSGKEENLNLEQEISREELLELREIDEQEIPIGKALPEIANSVSFSLPYRILTFPCRTIGKYLHRKASKAAYKTTSCLMKNTACTDDYNEN